MVKGGLVRKFFRKQTSRGDTIVEVLLATGVIGFVLASSAAVVNLSHRNQETSQERSEAIYELQGQIDSLRSKVSTAQVQAIIDGSGYKVFCISHDDGSIVSLTGTNQFSLPPLKDDDLSSPSPYPTACMDGRYFIAVEAPDDSHDTFTFHARWTGLNAPRDEVMYSYRLHKQGATTAVVPPPTCPLVSPVTYTFPAGGPRNLASSDTNRVTGPSGVGPLSRGPDALSLPAGGIPAWDNYTVTLGSYDTHDVGVPDTKLNERWRAILKDAGGGVTYTSPYSTDVPATVDGDVRRGPADVFTGVTIGGGTTTVTGEHINAGSDGFHLDYITIGCP